LATRGRLKTLLNFHVSGVKVALLQHCPMLASAKHVVAFFAFEAVDLK
jgi:hypothetical protein